jgi:hypothetical protein
MSIDVTALDAGQNLPGPASRTSVPTRATLAAAAHGIVNIRSTAYVSLLCHN